MSATGDTHHVRRHDELQLRRFLDARNAGDEQAARRWWEELLTANFDRVRGFVFVESRGLLSPDEQDDAVQRALIKMADRLIITFEGRSMGEWVEATRTLVKYACIDTQRRAARLSGRRRSLDGPDGQGMSPAVMAAIERARLEREADAAADEAAERVYASGRAFVDSAIPRLSKKRRAVIELDLAGVPVPEIQERLGISRDAVYQTRKRALADLAKLMDEQES